MKVPLTNTIKSAEEARQLAIDWQSWAGQNNLSYGVLAQWSNFFQVLAQKYNLTDEFKENGII